MTNQPKAKAAVEAPEAIFIRYAKSPSDIFAMRITLYAHNSVPPKYWPELYLMAEKAYRDYAAQREIPSFNPDGCVSFPLADLHFWKLTHNWRLKLRQINQPIDANSPPTPNARRHLIP